MRFRAAYFDLDYVCECDTLQTLNKQTRGCVLFYDGHKKKSVYDACLGKWPIASEVMVIGTWAGVGHLASLISKTSYLDWWHIVCY